MSTTVTSKGQVTIPKAVRDLLGIVPGSKVEFRRNEQGHIELVKANGEQPKSRFRRLLGHAKNGLTTDEIMQMSRGEE